MAVISEIAPDTRALRPAEVEAEVPITVHSWRIARDSSRGRPLGERSIWISPESPGGGATRTTTEHGWNPSSSSRNHTKLLCKGHFGQVAQTSRRLPTHVVNDKGHSHQQLQSHS
jgi:hypothetical protein